MRERLLGVGRGWGAQACRLERTDELAERGERGGTGRAATHVRNRARLRPLVDQRRWQCHGVGGNGEHQPPRLVQLVEFARHTARSSLVPRNTTMVGGSVNSSSAMSRLVWPCG